MGKRRDISKKKVTQKNKYIILYLVSVYQYYGSKNPAVKVS